MNRFVLSKSTLFHSDETEALAYFLKDMESVITGCGEGNQMQLKQAAEMPQESYLIHVDVNETVIHYAGKLGAIYALFFISERFLGIPPFTVWNGFTPAKKERVDIPAGEYKSKKQAVRYRGWFINDEVLLDGWKTNAEEQREMWRMVFETLLRCGGNMVIPGTDRQGDWLERLASDMGLILSHHHAELLGAEMFGRKWPDLQASYRLYPDKFEQLWKQAAEKYRGRRVIYAIGFRGQGDGPFWGEDNLFDTDEKRGMEITRVMQRQMQVVREIDPQATFCTNLYGEMMHLYRSGCLQIPQGVIKIWADNGFGRMLSRRQGSSNPRVDSMPRHEQGENGIYFHASFYDLQAANHITQLQVPPGIIAQELRNVLDNGADTYWMINTGSIKPHVYMLDLIREIWAKGYADVNAHAEIYGATYFGSKEAGALFLGYADCAVQYGAEADNLAGDQYYHFAIRDMACRLMRGDLSESQGLRWAEQGSLFEQAAAFEKRCKPAIARWEAFLSACERVAAKWEANHERLLRDTLIMNGSIHLFGCKMMCAFGKALGYYKQKEYDGAFFFAGKALGYAEEAYKALHMAEHDSFAHYYHNDCFTNLGLTVQVLQTFRGWIRACHDGPFFWQWERKWLMDAEEVRICLLTHRHCQLTDDVLFAQMDKTNVWEQR